jgi:hypothetical protein
MSLITLKLPPGIERDNTPYESPDRWWEMDQVRWSRGSMASISTYGWVVPRDA